MAWSERQQLALAITPKVSSLLSLMGSCWLVGEIWTEDGSPRRKRHHPYHRLLFAMSIYDILESGWNFLSTWPIPEETEDVWRPRGNQQTCSAQGFFLTLSVAVPIYNAQLALYYMLVIKYNISDHILRKRVEPVMHAVAFLWAFGTASYSAAAGLINNANLWCWIAPLPADCKDSWRFGDEGNCVRGDNAWIYRWAFYFAPLWFCIFFATVCTLVVYAKVKHLDLRTLQYRRPQTRVSFLGVVVDGGETSKHASAELQKNAGQERQEFEKDNESKQSEDAEITTTLALSEELARDSTDPRSSLFQRALSRRRQFAQDNPRTYEVFQQSLWYLAVFYVTHIWSTTNRIIQQVNGGQTFFGLILVHSWFDPLQGFLNFLVYQRPRYNKYRKGPAQQSVFQSLRKALVWTCRLDPQNAHAESPRRVG